MTRSHDEMSLLQGKEKYASSGQPTQNPMFTMIPGKAEKLPGKTPASQLSQTCEAVARKSGEPACGNEAQKKKRIFASTEPSRKNKTRSGGLGWPKHPGQLTCFHAGAQTRAAGLDARLRFRPLAIQKPGSSTTCEQKWLCGWPRSKTPRGWLRD